MDVQNVTVIGAGNGGITAAADLTDRGFTVTLYESPEFSGNLEGIRKRRGSVLDDGMDEKFIEYTDVTTNIEKAVRDADVIIVTVPGFAVENTAKALEQVAGAD